MNWSTKRLHLHLVKGGRTQDEGRLYRLREPRDQHAPVEESWPKDGAWRELVQRLAKNPVRSEES